MHNSACYNGIVPVILNRFWILNVSNDLMGMAVSYIFIIIAELPCILYDACAALRALGNDLPTSPSASSRSVLNMAGVFLSLWSYWEPDGGHAVPFITCTVIAFIVYVYGKRYELWDCPGDDLTDSHLLRRHLKLATKIVVPKEIEYLKTAEIIWLWSNSHHMIKTNDHF